MSTQNVHVLEGSCRGCNKSLECAQDRRSWHWHSVSEGIVYYLTRGRSMASYGSAGRWFSAMARSVFAMATHLTTTTRPATWNTAWSQRWSWTHESWNKIAKDRMLEGFRRVFKCSLPTCHNFHFPGMQKAESSNEDDSNTELEDRDPNSLNKHLQVRYW